MNDEEPRTRFLPALGQFYLTALEQTDREEIVALSTSGAAADLLTASSFELSALGASAALAGNWAPRSGVDLVAWNDLGQGGRTVHTVVVRSGYLFPLGHRATISEIYQRAIAVDPANAASDPADYPVAYLQRQSVIQVTEPVKTYPAFGQPFAPPVAATGAGTTDWPFISVRMSTLTSPALDQGRDVVHLVKPQALWPTVDGDDVLWDFVAVDAHGHDVPFQMPLVFVYGQDLTKNSNGPNSEFSTWTADLVSAYLDTDPAMHPTTSRSGGGPLTFAPEVAGSGSTTHPILAVTLGARTSQQGRNALKAADQPNFYPVVAGARIRLHAAEALAGAALADTVSDPAGVGGVAFEYYPGYVQHGVSQFGVAGGASATSNLGALYLQAVDPPQLDLPSATVGGVATPDIGIAALSAVSGLVGGTLADLPNFAEVAQAVLKDYFAAATAQLLGGLPLNGILDPARFSTPTIVSELEPQTGVLTVHYQLATRLTSYPTPGADSYPIFVPDAGSTLQLEAIITVVPGAPPTYTINGSIEPFMLFLVGQNSSLDFISLHFESLRFSSGNGSSPAVDVNLDHVQFDGSLKFINPLAAFLQGLGGSGLSVAVHPTDVTVSTSVALPAIGIGVLQLSGLSFAGGLVLPLVSGSAVATFSIASADNPFTLAVAMFGGGGYLTMALGFGGVQSIQGALEFGGHFALDLEVASGSLSLVAGVYYSYTTPVPGSPPTGGTELSGFVRVSGQLCVLGILTISASLDLTLDYASSDNSVWGSAQLTVGVSVCGIGKSVSITVSKSFSGSPPPNATTDVTPGINHRVLGAAGGTGTAAATAIGWDDLVSDTSWAAYCSAFGTGIPDFS